MATPREIKKKISVIQNTKKITKTMEMVSTAKAKKASDLVNKAIPYAKKIQELMDSISSSKFEGESKFPLLRKPNMIKKKIILSVTSDRGLCGAFNNNVIKETQQLLQEEHNKNVDIELHIMGKKIISTFSYLKISSSQSYINLEEKLNVDFVSNLIQPFVQAYKEEKLDAFDIISTRYLSSSSQVVKVTPILPLAFTKNTHQDANNKDVVSYLFEPNPEEILSSLLPRSILLSVYQVLLESIASEHIARRIAMKNATENASELLRNMTRQYNRARQAKITQEISEIVGGASAIS